MDIQPGDVEKTFANIDCAKDKLNYNPKTSIKEGIPKFIEWYKSYHKSNNQFLKTKILIKLFQKKYNEKLNKITILSSKVVKWQLLFFKKLNV